ncbi:MAG TPA: hypothetical protein VLG76_04740 [Rhabdochlamydiaceae bacterium]|nr:hypothetical protein [Rhabdochlamydiaceae bacterium]
MYKIVLSFLFLVSSLHSKQADYITYDWLIDVAKKTAYTDHIPHFRKLFNTMKVRGLLECGCGYSTKYFIDHCKKVVTIEFVTEGYGDGWYWKCVDLYRDCPNWFPNLYNPDAKNLAFNTACGYQCSQHRDYALIDPTYLYEMDRYFKQLLSDAHDEKSDIDVGFVDAGVYIRGDMVKLLLANKVPIVMAHDTGSDEGSDVTEGLYGWFKVKTPPDYEKIFIPFGMSTTFWISKTLPHVIDAILEYQKLIKERGIDTFEELTSIIVEKE